MTYEDAWNGLLSSVRARAESFFFALGTNIDCPPSIENIDVYIQYSKAKIALTSLEDIINWMESIEKKIPQDKSLKVVR